MHQSHCGQPQWHTADRSVNGCCYIFVTSELFCYFVRKLFCRNQKCLDEISWQSIQKFLRYFWADSMRCFKESARVYFQDITLGQIISESFTDRSGLHIRSTGGLMVIFTCCEPSTRSVTLSLAGLNWHTFPTSQGWQMCWDCLLPGCSTGIRSLLQCRSAL